MPVVTRSPSLDTAVTGTWTNPTNVQADDGAVAATTIAAKNASAVREQGNYGFDAQIPAGSTIDAVELLVEHRVSTTASIATLGVRARIGTTDLTRQDDAAEPTVLTARVYNITALRAWTRADLLDGTLKTRTEAVQGNNATSCTYEWDYVQVRVTYTAPPAQISAASVSDADRDMVNNFTDVVVDWTEPMQTAAAVGGAIRVEVSDDGGTNWYATTYRSGSGSQNGWKVRVARILRNGQVVQVRYRAAAAGSSVTAVDDGAQSADITVTATNNLTKRIQFTLRNAAGALVATTTCKYAIQVYAGGDPSQATWLNVDQRGTTVTSAAGLFDVQYTGSAAVGAQVYVTVIYPHAGPTQSLIWHETVD